MVFSKSTQTVSGNLPVDIREKIGLVMDSFLNHVNQISEKNDYRRAMIRSRLSCHYLVILDSQTLWIVGEKQAGMMHNIFLDYRSDEFSAQAIQDAAKWEFGLELPFIISFPAKVLNQEVSFSNDTIHSIAESHIEEERKRVMQETNIIKINPVFGAATYQIDPRLVFILMPFKKDLTEIYKTVVKPTVEQFDLVCRRADDIKSNKAIIQDIWKSICEAKVIIADMSELNPNVMYELGIAHTLGKETILLYQRSSEEIRFPFDLSHIRRIEYENTIPGSNRLSSELKQTIENIIAPKIVS